MSCLGNVLWFVLGGWWTALMYILLGVLFCITIIGIPIGKACFQYAKLMAFPFGKEIVKETFIKGKENVSAVRRVFGFIANIIWFPFGLVTLIGNIGLMLVCCITIILIPVAVVLARSCKFLLWPVGAKVISKEEYQAIVNANVMKRTMAAEQERFAAQYQTPVAPMPAPAMPQAPVTPVIAPTPVAPELAPPPVAPIPVVGTVPSPVVSTPEVVAETVIPPIPVATAVAPVPTVVQTPVAPQMSVAPQTPVAPQMSVAPQAPTPTASSVAEKATEKANDAAAALGDLANTCAEVGKKAGQTVLAYSEKAGQKVVAYGEKAGNAMKNYSQKSADYLKQLHNANMESAASRDRNLSWRDVFDATEAAFYKNSILAVLLSFVEWIAVFFAVVYLIAGLISGIILDDGFFALIASIIWKLGSGNLIFFVLGLLCMIKQNHKFALGIFAFLDIITFLTIFVSGFSNLMTTILHLAIFTVLVLVEVKVFLNKQEKDIMQ